MTSTLRTSVGVVHALALTVAFALNQSGPSRAADWTVPVAGNAYQTANHSGGRGLRRGGTLGLSNPEDVYSVFFRVDRPAVMKIAVQARAADGASTLVTRVGDDVFRTSIETAKNASCLIGRIKADKAGYVRVDLQADRKQDEGRIEISDLLVTSDTDGLSLDFVKTNAGNMFYWGRRGPSVHLRYEVPRDRPLQYAYSELTVPVGQDPIGSYFMANGFGEGYFGIQVNGPEERRVLFSVWSPFKTDNPREIPADQQIVMLAKGPDVRVGEFGNEGSGGQSFLVYPWKAGTTYRFLTEVRPDEMGNTIYTSWFGDKSQQTWRLIASFRRPKTDTHLTGFHCFLENFSPSHGHIGRRAAYGNVWVRDVSGQWHQCTRARFSVDATGGGRHRLDFTGGADGNQFFLRNCGFFDETGRPGETFTRQSTDDDRPEIDFDTLP
ncbi:hypothetical protein Mal15_44520 [Stieleria maiorica]|uniref:DUF5077 domain-containing protein n=1 Tax=Stieleria maiorica TaxID=2795974 RepID=A0A5B9MGI8_9BACT|nr:DUF3472 domain-containing protein [Stieleria maiorica]QEG00382.1 hypothetical protein Mal15_44520 [Stieleria maiorica]